MTVKIQFPDGQTHNMDTRSFSIMCGYMKNEDHEHQTFHVDHGRHLFRMIRESETNMLDVWKRVDFLLSAIGWSVASKQQADAFPGRGVTRLQSTSDTRNAGRTIHFSSSEDLVHSVAELIREIDRDSQGPTGVGDNFKQR